MRYLMPFQYFKAVAKARSVRGAAQDLAITPSALNRRIQDFEAEVGMPLFERSHEGLSLNAAGELVMSFVQSQSFELSKLHAQLHDLQGLKRGHICFACTQALTSSSLPHILAAFRKDHPFVTFDIRALRGNQEEPWLRDKEIEFGVCIGRQRSHEFESLFSVPCRIGVLVSKGHHLFDEKVIKLGQLVGEDLTVPNKDFRLYEVIERAFLARRLPFEPLIQTDDFNLGNQLSAINCTLSFRLVQPYNLRRENGETRLIPIAETDLPPAEIQILKARAARLSPLSEALCHSLELEFAKFE